MCCLRQAVVSPSESIVPSSAGNRAALRRCFFLIYCKHKQQKEISTKHYLFTVSLSTHHPTAAWLLANNLTVCNVSRQSPPSSVSCGSAFQSPTTEFGNGATSMSGVLVLSHSKNACCFGAPESVWTPPRVSLIGLGGSC